MIYISIHADRIGRSIVEYNDRVRGFILFLVYTPHCRKSSQTLFINSQTDTQPR